MKRHATSVTLTAAALFFVAQVYGAEPKKSSAIPALVQRALASGEEDLFAASLAKTVGLPEMACQHFYVPDSSTTDGAHHQLHVLVDEEGTKLTPRYIVFDRQVDAPGTTDGWYLRTDLTGRLEAVARIQGKVDEKNEPIRGSGTITNPPITSPEVRALFQHELDFWLKNAYRKPKPKKKP